jgi:hypothetical protein
MLHRDDSHAGEMSCSHSSMDATASERMAAEHFSHGAYCMQRIMRENSTGALLVEWFRALKAAEK